MGSPEVSIVLTEHVIFKNPPDLLTIFMCGWAAEHIKTKKYEDKTSGFTAGINAVIKYYERNKDNIPKDKSVKKFIKAKRKGKLADYIKEILPAE